MAARRNCGPTKGFARYLEELASVTIATLSSTSHPEAPELPEAPNWLASGRRLGIAAGLGARVTRLTACRAENGKPDEPCRPRLGRVTRCCPPTTPAPPADLNALHAAVWPRGAARGGVLTLGVLDVRDLAAPIFVTDEEDVRGRCREYLDAFEGADGMGQRGAPG